MKNKLVVEIAEGLGNQLFMYAHAYTLSKKINYDLLIDNTSGYFKKKNLLRPHQKFMLDCFNIKKNFAPADLKYDTDKKRFLKKILVILDNFKFKKKFLIERKIKTNNVKFVSESNNSKQVNFSENIYVQGNFENYQYFESLRNDFIKLFTPQSTFVDLNNPLINDIKNSNSISILVRRHRFSDQGKLTNNPNNLKKSEIFTNQTIDYINNSIKYLKNKVTNPKFFIWSNDFKNFKQITDKIIIPNFTLVKTTGAINDFYLFKFSKHFIVSPSSFHWWGAWLNENPDKICLRPSNLNPSNNSNFWPKDWIII